MHAVVCRTCGCYAEYEKDCWGGPSEEQGICGKCVDSKAYESWNKSPAPIVKVVHCKQAKRANELMRGIL